MAETEKARLLCSCGNPHEGEGHKFKQGYIDCAPNCQCGGICEKCVQYNLECMSDCSCRQDACSKCKQNKRTRGNRICLGASNILGKWPYYLLYTLLIVLSLLFLLILIFIIIFTILMHHRNSSPTKTDAITKRHSLCKEITAENSTLFLMGYVDGSEEKAKKFIEPTKNVFYVLNKPLTIEQACNVESSLRLLTDRLFYVIEFYNKKKIEENDYITYLQRHYVNLNRINVNQTHFFQGSLFENDWKTSSESLMIFAAKTLSIWQFGGMVLSENILMNSREVIDSNKDTCIADRDIIYCPQDCAAYTYELMKIISNKMKSNISRIDVIEDIIDNSINDFCGSDVAKVGCSRVYRLSKSDMCEGNDYGACQFIRKENSEGFQNYIHILKQFCPYIMLV